MDQVKIFKTPEFFDNRGSLRKLFDKSILSSLPNSFNIDEVYYSNSRKGVLRGMHGQIAPSELTKLVFVSQGKILDVLLDVRKKSASYGEVKSITLTDKNKKAVFVPPGVLHGFLCLSKTATVHYLQNGNYSPELECGLHYDSFGFDWPVDNPILSDKDKSLAKFTK